MGKYRMNRINDAVVNEMAVILREVKDPRINCALVSITGAEVTGDLKYAKIFFSVYGGDPVEIRRALQKAAGFFRSELARRINLRVTPELTFIHDESIAYGAGISAILNNLEISPLEDNESEESADGADNGDLFD